MSKPQFNKYYARRGGFTPQGDGTIKSEFQTIHGGWLSNSYTLKEFPEFIKVWERTPGFVQGEQFVEEAKLAYQMELELEASNAS